MSENKHLFLFAGILVFCLVLFTLVYVYEIRKSAEPSATVKQITHVKQPSVVDSKAAEPISRKQQIQEDLSVLNNALETINTNTCNAIADITLRTSCSELTILTQARSEKDPSLCEKIKEPEIIERCKEKTLKYIEATS